MPTILVAPTKDRDRTDAVTSLDWPIEVFNYSSMDCPPLKRFEDINTTCTRNSRNAAVPRREQVCFYSTSFNQTHSSISNSIGNLSNLQKALKRTDYVHHATNEIDVEIKEPSSVIRINDHPEFQPAQLSCARLTRRPKNYTRGEHLMFPSRAENRTDIPVTRTLIYIKLYIKQIENFWATSFFLPLDSKASQEESNTIIHKTKLLHHD
jgi:hypothetical protein